MNGHEGRRHALTTGTGIVLESSGLLVEVTPSKGCDVRQIVHRGLNQSMLFESPWRSRAHLAFPASADPMSQWLARYPGGWQVLLPTVGSAKNGDGTDGLHGEASLVPWHVEERTEKSLLASASLVMSPLSCRRLVQVDGQHVTIADSVLNQAADPYPVNVVHHPAFGAPLVGPSTRIQSSAGCVRFHAGGSPSEFSDGWTELNGMATDGTDLSTVGSEPKVIFATLGHFDDGHALVGNPELGCAILLTWDPSVLSYAWFWQDLHGSTGFPWHNRAYVTAIEPATVAADGAGTVSVDGRDRLRLALTLSVIDDWSPDSEVVVDQVAADARGHQRGAIAALG